MSFLLPLVEPIHSKISSCFAKHVTEEKEPVLLTEGETDTVLPSNEKVRRLVHPGEIIAYGLVAQIVLSGCIAHDPFRGDLLPRLACLF